MFKATHIAVLTVLGVSSVASALEVSAQDGEFSRGDSLILKINNYSGPLIVESDFSRTSSQTKVNDRGEISLGPVADGGVKTAHVYPPGSPEQGWVGTFLVLPAEDGQAITVIALDASAAAKPTEIKEPETVLLTKFSEALDADRFRKSVEQVGREWLAENVVGLSGTFVICVIPSQQITCAFRAGGHALDLGVAILDDMVKQMRVDRVLTKTEADRIRMLLGIGNFAGQVALNDALAGRVLALVDGGLQATVHTPEGKLMAKFSTDFAGKFVMLIRLAK